MSQTVETIEGNEPQQLHHRKFKFEGLVIDSIYNTITYLPVAIISWLISNIEY